jgi:hypothetical protein
MGEFNVETAKAPAQRTPLNIEVEYRKNYAREATAGTLKNISLTGAFLKHSGESLKVGEKLVVNFMVAGRERLVHANVVWTNSIGSGVRFQPTNNRDVQIVDDLIYYVESKREGTRGIMDEIFKKVG